MDLPVGSFLKQQTCLKKLFSLSFIVDQKEITQCLVDLQDLFTLIALLVLLRVYI